MDFSLLWRAAVVQAVLVAAAFAVLVAAPLPEGFFRDYGFVAGPLAWLACSAGTAALLSLPARRALVAAAVGGAVGAAVGALVHHDTGLVVAILAFAAVAARRSAVGVS